MLKTKRTRGEWRKKHSRRVATFGLKSRVDGKLVTPEMPWFLGRVLNTSTRQPLPTPAQISSTIMYRRRLLPGPVLLRAMLFIHWFQLQPLHSTSPQRVLKVVIPQNPRFPGRVLKHKGVALSRDRTGVMHQLTST